MLAQSDRLVSQYGCLQEVAFSSLARILGEYSIIHSQPARFFVVVFVVGVVVVVFGGSGN